MEREAECGRQNGVSVMQCVIKKENLLFLSRKYARFEQEFKELECFSEVVETKSLIRKMMEQVLSWKKRKFP